MGFLKTEYDRSQLDCKSGIPFGCDGVATAFRVGAVGRKLVLTSVLSIPIGQRFFEAWKPLVAAARSVRPSHAGRKPCKKIGTFLWRGFDVCVVDGVVNGTAWVVKGLAAGLRYTQSGFLHNYAMAMVVGVVVIVGYYVFG